MSWEDEALQRLRATAHPVRLRIMSLLTGAELSAAEVARELDLTQANASYHLRRLSDAGKVEVVGTQNVRGGKAKKYRYTEFRGSDDGPQPWRGAESSPGSLQAILEAVGVELQRRAAQHGHHPAVQTQLVFADVDPWLPPVVGALVFDHVERASRLAHAAALPPRTEGAVPVSIVASLFTMPGEAARTERS